VAPTAKVDQKKIFKALAEIIEALKDNNPELALRLNLQAVQAINNVNNPTELED
jgi:flagellar biosynthesis/type III secretory pathway protein FliH